MQLFGKSAKLAVSSVLAMLSRPAGELTSAAEIAEEIHDSPTYVAKILQELARQGILGSRRGANGGFYLKKHPVDITMWDLVSPFEGPLDDQHCMIDGGKVCEEGNVCGMHAYWARISREVIRTLKQTTLLHLWRHSVRNRSSTGPGKDAPCGSGDENGLHEVSEG